MPDHLRTAERLVNPLTLASAASVGLAPASPGIYEWWMRKGVLDVLGAAYQERDGSQLHYVGMSPRKSTAAGRATNGNLRSRLATYTTKDASRSTLRRTSAWRARS